MRKRKNGRIPPKKGRRWTSTGPAALGQYGIGLGNVEDGCVPGTAIAALRLVRLGALVPGRFVALALAGDERANLDAMLAAAHLPAERAPSVISEDVLARLDVVLGNALGHEAGEDRGPVG